MMYHVTEDGPRRCRATKASCPYAQEGGPHFENPHEAQVYYDRSMEAKYGLLGKSIAKDVRFDLRQQMYRRLWHLERKNKLVAKIAQHRLENYHRPPRGRDDFFARAKQNRLLEQRSKISAQHVRRFQKVKRGRYPQDEHLAMLARQRAKQIRAGSQARRV